MDKFEHLDRRPPEILINLPSARSQDVINPCSQGLERLSLFLAIGVPIVYSVWSNIDPRLLFKELKRVDCCPAVRGFTGDRASNVR